MRIRWLPLSPVALATLLVQCTAPVDEQAPTPHETQGDTDYRVVQIEAPVVIGADDHTGWLTKINQQLGGVEPRLSVAGGLRVHDAGRLMLQVAGTLRLEPNTRVEFPADLYLRADRVVLEAGSVLRVAGAATVHANTIEGSGRIDTSGDALPALEANESQTEDPELARVVQGLLGDGDDGDDGDQGDAGDDAVCRLFSSDAAFAGDDGLNGTDGNSGISGGNISLFVFNVTGYNLNARGGHGGDGGHGR
ncbi:MAG TPA: hypothetical protein VK509_09005, partial [Polyangiales bacterium]|nr:hypothetical protein [Polyangiales bacterium]